MRIEAEPCYVLHARAWRETSLLLEVLSAQHGRLGLVARGVQGPRRQVLRAALQPLQFIRIDALQRGELAQLRSAEALDIAPQLTGDVALAAFYVNELVLRLAPRSDPQPDLFTAYGRVRARLGAGDALAWTLRRFERDLLDALGSGFALEVDGDGNAIDPAARYRFDGKGGTFTPAFEWTHILHFHFDLNFDRHLGFGIDPDRDNAGIGVRIDLFCSDGETLRLVAIKDLRS